jgi:hypothetical protein
MMRGVKGPGDRIHLWLPGPSGRPADRHIDPCPDVLLSNIAQSKTSLAAHDIATEAGNGDAPDTRTFCFNLLEREQY